ncbi:MAG: type 1 glutamine amidotransferase [Streptosporangiaceae bacterium]
MSGHGLAGHGRLLVIEHELDAPAGLLGAWAQARGLTLSVLRLGRGDRLPDRLPDCAGVVVLGSEQTAFDDAVPWLAGELALVTQALADGIPLLGICFGGQVLARALGACVYRLPKAEIGWVRLASQHPGLAAGPWLEWHQDGFDLPPGARELATGGASVQAYAIGPHLGLQFHPEATEPITQAWLPATQPPLSPARSAALRQGWQDAGDRAAAEAAALFSAWLDGEFAAAPAHTAEAGPAGVSGQ